MSFDSKGRVEEAITILNGLLNTNEELRLQIRENTFEANAIKQDLIAYAVDNKLYEVFSLDVNKMTKLLQLDPKPRKVYARNR